MRVDSIHSRVHSAPSAWSSSSPYSSCRPVLVPSYRALSSASAVCERFAALSNVEPRVTYTDSSVRVVQSRNSLIGLGVVVTTTRGRLPIRNAGAKPSVQVSYG